MSRLENIVPKGGFFKGVVDGGSTSEAALDLDTLGNGECVPGDYYVIVTSGYFCWCVDGYRQVVHMPRAVRLMVLDGGGWSLDYGD